MRPRCVRSTWRRRCIRIWGRIVAFADVEKARAALEKSYHDRGFQTVSVSVPDAVPHNGVVVLKVTELKVGRLR